MEYKQREYPLFSACGVLSCIQRKGLEYCCKCDKYPCKKYNGADQSDSFITHIKQLHDLVKAKTLGIDAYKNELNEKISMFKTLPANYDDGRRKGLFCLAVNLLELQQVNYVMEQLVMDFKCAVSQMSSKNY